jgi:hypothetical protein
MDTVILEKVRADAQDGPADQPRHVVDQLPESADGENLAALNPQRGRVGIERHELAPQLRADFGRPQQIVPVLRLVAMDAIDIAGVSQDQAEAARPGVEVNMPLFVFELAETKVVVVGSLCVGHSLRRTGVSLQV